MHHDDHDDHVPTQAQDRDESGARPDEPTTSDEATLVERGEGAHAEYAAAPETMRDNPPPQHEGASGGEDD